MVTTEPRPEDPGEELVTCRRLLADVMEAMYPFRTEQSWMLSPHTRAVFERATTYLLRGPRP